MTAITERNRVARKLFAPLAGTYDRYARLLSFGQDPRWRAFLVSRIEARPEETILDVACGTAAVALELVGRYGCGVVGVDQSAEMLAEGRRRVAQAQESGRITLVSGRAEALPFEDARFDGATFTYLLRYVEDPGATLREIARVVRPGGRIASLDFSIPRHPLARISWELYVRAGLPVLGATISPGWGRAGRFLGRSIRSFWERHPLEQLLSLWEAAGMRGVQARGLSLGGGVVIWGERGD